MIVSSEYLHATDRVLIIDDFLSSARTINALVKIVEGSGATLVGIGAVIEKEFAGGRNAIGRHDIAIESLAVIEKFEDEKIVFK